MKDKKTVVYVSGRCFEVIKIGGDFVFEPAQDHDYLEVDEEGFLEFFERYESRPLEQAKLLVGLAECLIAIQKQYQELDSDNSWLDIKRIMDEDWRFFVEILDELLPIYPELPEQFSAFCSVSKTSSSSPRLFKSNDKNYLELFYNTILHEILAKEGVCSAVDRERADSMDQEGFKSFV